MPLIRQTNIVRADLQNNPGVFYVFGDNMARIGLGGQAKEMRGEPNAIGVVTKHHPYVFFSKSDDHPGSDAWIEMARDLSIVREKLAVGKIVVWPSAGIGSGLAKLENHCPQMYAFQLHRLRELSEAYRA